jgi:hypothetical protein
MKKLYTLYFLLILSYPTLAQVEVFFARAETDAVISISEESKCTIYVGYNGVLKGKVEVMVSVAADLQTGTANPNTDYQFFPVKLTFTSDGPKTLPVEIVVRSSATANRFLHLRLTSKSTAKVKIKVTRPLTDIHLITKSGTSLPITGSTARRAVNTTENSNSSAETSSPDIATRQDRSPILSRVTVIDQRVSASFSNSTQELILKEGTEVTEARAIIRITGDVSQPGVLLVRDTGEGDANEDEETYSFNTTSLPVVPNGLKEFDIKINIKPNAKAGKKIVLQLSTENPELIGVGKALHTITFQKSPVKIGTVGFAKRDLEIEVGDEEDHEIPVELKLSEGEKLIKPITVRVNVVGGSAENGKDKDFVFSGNVSELAFSAIDPNLQSTIPIHILKSAKSGGTIMLKLTTKDAVKIGQEFMTIKLVEKPIAFNPYRISLGSNFNLLDGVSLEKLYADASVFLPNAFGKIPRNKYVLNTNGTYEKVRLYRSWGFEAGLYNNRSFPIPNIDLADKTAETIRLLSPIPTPPFGNTVIVQRKVYTDSTSFSLDNLGFYFQTMVQLTPSTKQKTNVYLLAHAEVIRRTQVQTTKATLNSSVNDTLIYNAELARQLNGVQQSYVSGRFTRQLFDAYFGPGLLIHHLGKAVEFRVKGILAFGSIASRLINTDIKTTSTLVRQPPSNPWEPTFIVNFTLMERTSGIKMGGEIRGYLANTAPNIPYIYLAKEFDISRLLGFGDGLKIP